jgi:hypothetical protein
MRSQTTVKTNPSIERAYQRVPTGQLEVNIEEYEALLLDPRLDAEQRAAFLAALWSVIVTFIDLGYRVHPVEQAIDDLHIGEDVNRAIIRAIDSHWHEAA